MNKQTARMFALGILFTLLIVWPAQYFTQPAEEERTKPTVADAKQLLKKEGYSVLSQSQLAELESKTAEKQPTPSKKQPKGKDADQKEKAEKEQAAQLEKEKAAKENEVKKFTLNITKGMSPGEISSLLKENKIIKDSGEFEKYLIDNDFHTDIQIGRYTLDSKMDFNKISKVITKND
ncbi:hypothetical protein [Bacillus massilinigeriensis]|uniref:hypothetical protein n=1 Tax=Bacillus mediterraneensis TaxID=1805474 RepID=UPI0008F8E42F|nr:hypothetical protein [Bacillus mediterraneensis]